MEIHGDLLLRVKTSQKANYHLTSKVGQIRNFIKPNLDFYKKVHYEAPALANL